MSNWEAEGNRPVDSDAQFQASVEAARQEIDGLLTEAKGYVERIPEVKRWEAHRDRLKQYFREPYNQRAHAAYDAVNAKVQAFYHEHKLFTRRVAAAIEGLSSVLPEHEIRRLKALFWDNPESVYQTLEQARQRLEVYRAAPSIQATTDIAVAITSPDHGSSQVDTKARKRERRVARDAYKDECKDAGVTVTDEMIARAANQRWHTRDAVQKWLTCDPRYDGEPDRLIRKVFSDKPHTRR
jgi:hypothetical protein